MEKPYLSPKPGPSHPWLVPSLAPVGSRRWPPPPPSRPRTCVPAWPLPRAGDDGDKLPRASPIHSPPRFSSSARIPSFSLLPPLEPARPRAGRCPGHRNPSPSTPLAPPRRPGRLCRSRSLLEPCNARNTVVFLLRPPDLSRRFVAPRPSPSRLSSTLHSL